MEAASTTSSAASSVDGRSVGGSSDFLNLGMFAGGAAGGASQQHQGELLVGGASGFTSTAGGTTLNGFGNDGPSGTTPGTSFDLSEFPSLRGTGNSQPGSGNDLAAALRQQQQQQLLAQHQQQQMLGAQHQVVAAQNKSNNLYRLAMTAGANGNFNMATEDFPALSGAPQNASNSASLSGASSLLNASSISARIAPSGGGGGLYGSSDLENAASTQLDGGAGTGGLLGGAGLGGLGGLRGLQQQPTSNNPNSALPARAPSSASGGPSGAPGAVGSSTSGGGATASSGSTVGNALGGDYGLLGLLGVIRMTDADRNSLALGSDLTMLGLNLGSAEQIYNTFSSPWSDVAVSKEPHYQLPTCYYMQPPALKTGHLSKFQLETLFYIFYALPQDVLQAYAAQELYSREWRYHGELKLWFKRAGPSDGIQANNPSSGGSTQYLYFDINTWERRLFNGSMNQNITSGFLPEDEVRVKFPSS